MYTILQKNNSGILEYEVREVKPNGSRWDASPAPTCRLLSDTGGVIITSTACSAGYSGVLTSPVAVDGTSLSVSTTFGLSRGDTLWIGPNSSGYWQDAVVDAVAPTSITILYGSDYTFSVSDAVKSHKLSVVFSDSQLTANYYHAKAEWSYYVDGHKRTDYTIVHVCTSAPRLSLTPSSVVRYCPTAKHLAGGMTALWHRIRRVWERDVLVDVGSQLKPGGIVSADLIEQATLYRVLEHIHLDGNQREQADTYRALYTQAMDRALSSQVIDLDDDGDADGPWISADCVRIDRG